MTGSGRRGRFDVVAIVAVFALVGPPLGSVAWGLITMVASWLSVTEVDPGFFLFLGFLYAPVSYALAMPAALVAAATASAQYLLQGRVGFIWPCLAALASGAALALLKQATPAVAAILVAAHLVAAVACVAILRRVFFARAT